MKKLPAFVILSLMGSATIATPAMAEQGIGYAAAYESLSFRDTNKSISILPVHSFTLIDDSGAVSAGLQNAASSNAAQKNAEADIDREVREGKRQGAYQTKEYSYREVAPVAGIASRFSLVLGSSKSLFEQDFWVQSPESVTDRTDIVGLEISRHFADFQFGPVDLNLGWDFNARIITLNSIVDGKTAKSSTYTLNGPPTLSFGCEILPVLYIQATGKLGLFGAYGYFKDSAKTSLPYTLSSQVNFAPTSDFRIFGRAAIINDDLYHTGSSGGVKISTTLVQVGIDYLAE